MRVTVKSCTANPITVCSEAAGGCYGKSFVSYQRLANCFRDGHLSVFEHASVTFKVEGISRACMAQLTRHRMASFCVESQRYNKYNLAGDDWYVVPHVFEDDPEMLAGFRAHMDDCAEAYMLALQAGVKAQDARFLLPEATKTSLTVTMNLREFYHFLDLRADSAAQWEIQELAEAMKEAVRDIDDQWRQLIELWEW